MCSCGRKVAPKVGRRTVKTDRKVKPASKKEIKHG